MSWLDWSFELTHDFQPIFSSEAPSPKNLYIPLESSPPVTRRGWRMSPLNLIGKLPPVIMMKKISQEQQVTEEYGTEIVQGVRLTFWMIWSFLIFFVKFWSIGRIVRDFVYFCIAYEEVQNRSNRSIEAYRWCRSRKWNWSYWHCMADVPKLWCRFGRFRLRRDRNQCKKMKKQGKMQVLSR